MNLDVGVIGTGVMGRNHVRIYSELREASEVYIYDANMKAAKEIGDELDVNVSSSVDALLKKVDAVSICVPTRYHFEVAKNVIDSGIGCLIEKPVTLSSKDGVELLRIAGDRDDQVIGVGHVERFNPIMSEIKNLLIEPRYIEIRRHNPGSVRIKDSSVALDLMIHDIDLVWNYLLAGDEDLEMYSMGDDDLFKAVVRFDGCLVSLSASRIACSKIRTIHVEEEGFTVDGDFMKQEVYIHRKPGKYSETNNRYTQENIIENVRVNKVEPLKEELKTFLMCIRERRPFPVTLQQGVQSLRIAESRGLKLSSGSARMDTDSIDAQCSVSNL